MMRYSLTSFKPIKLKRPLVAITQELEDLLEQESGIVFDDFFNDWFRGEGFPLFDITWSQQDSVFAINFQQTPSTANGPAFHTPLEVELTFAEAQLEL